MPTIGSGVRVKCSMTDQNVCGTREPLSIEKCNNSLRLLIFFFYVTTISTNKGRPNKNWVEFITGEMRVCDG